MLGEPEDMVANLISERRSRNYLALDAGAGALACEIKIYQPLRISHPPNLDRACKVPWSRSKIPILQIPDFHVGDAHQEELAKQGPLYTRAACPKLAEVVCWPPRDLTIAETQKRLNTGSS